MTYAGYVLRHLTARPLRATLTAGAFAFSIGLLARRPIAALLREAA